MTRVAVIGANGFLGGELVRLLAMHPHARMTVLCAGSSAGKALGAVRPGLRGAGPLQLVAFDADLVAQEADLAFLALPHGESGLCATALVERGVRVIDLGSDLRLADPGAHRQAYGREPTAPQLAANAWYGLPELTGPPPGGWTHIANPGCFATALALTIAPVAGLTSDIAAFGVTGSSGSGITPTTGVHHSLRMTSFTAYKPLTHQHLGELGQLLARRGATPIVNFVPHSLPVARGIHLTLLFRAPVDAVKQAYQQAYRGAAMVDVTDGEVPMGAVQASNRAWIGVTGSGDQSVVFCAIDNLIKGGSGQAIQNMNLGYGWSETAGLPTVGMWP